MKGAENEQTKIRCSKCVRVNQAPKLWDENATAIFELAAHCSLVRTIKLPLSKVTRCNDETARKAALVEYKTLTKMCGWVNVAFDRKSELYRQKASIQFHVASFETRSFAEWYSQQVLLNYLQSSWTRLIHIIWVRLVHCTQTEICKVSQPNKYHNGTFSVIQIWQ